MSWFIIRKKLLTFNFNLETSQRKEILRFLFWIGIAVISQYVVWNKSEIFFLNHFGTNTDIAIYSLGFGFVTMFMGIFSPMLNVINNSTSENVGNDNKDMQKQIFLRFPKYFLSLTGYLGLLFLAVGPVLVSFIYGKSFNDSFQVVYIVLPFQILINAFAPIWGVPTYKGDYKLFTILGLIGLVLTLTFDYFFIREWGIIGAAIANVSSQIVSSIIQAIATKIKYKIAFINLNILIIAGMLSLSFVFVILTPTLWGKLAVFFLSLFIYYYVSKRFLLDQKDYGLIKDLSRKLPGFIGKFVYRLCE